MRRPASLLLAVIVLSCLSCRNRVEQSPDDGQAVWFVHATDPHLFYADEKDDKVRLHQEKLNQAAFSDLIHSVGSVSGLESKPSFLLVTGDLGLDRFGAPAAPPAPATSQPVIKAPDQPAQAGVSAAERESAVSLMAETLKASPIKDIYFVLGNNDVAKESATGSELETTAAFIADVQKRIDPAGVKLHDLTSCYRHLPPGCVYDIPGTNFQLIGFSSYSFKNAGASYATNQKEQEAEIQQLATMVHQADAQGKKVLIATHIAEIDDPYPLGQSRFRGVQPGKSQRPDWAAFSPWNVSPAVYQGWKDIVDSGAVAGVLVGHFHDSHKELYYRPYRWATAPKERADLRKLFLAPPLAVRFQDQSPVQARGFALFRLSDDGIRRTFDWYDPESKSFKPDAPLLKSRPAPSPAFPKPITWLWEVVLVKVDLARAVVIALAFLAAFLTAVQLWEVPPPKSRLAAPAAQADAHATPTAPTTTTPTGALSSLNSNFVKTVLAGLGGMLALDFLGEIWKLDDINAKTYYVLMFIVFFFLLLLLYAFLQGMIEALRSRIATRRQPPPRDTRLARRHGGSQVSKAYWPSRIWRWLLSLRSFTLIFSDTFFNVIRGRNQLRTKIFEDTIIDLHRSIVRAADRIREEVDAALTSALQRINPTKYAKIPSSDIRVNISLLAEDESAVYYISRERGSLPVPFDKNSVAWISVYTGEARWVKNAYPKELILLDNTSMRYPSLPEVELPLGKYYQMRQSPDYEAFLILPVPLLQRGMDLGERKGAVQISFRLASYLDDLWAGLDAAAQGKYAGWREVFESSENSTIKIKDPQLQAVLHEALEVLAELLRSFNDSVFEEYLKPSLLPT